MRFDPTLKPHDLVEVRWNDAHTRGDWASFKDHVRWAEDHDKWAVRSVGFLIEQTDLGISLAQSWAEVGSEREDVMSDAIYIPAGVVQSVRLIEAWSKDHTAEAALRELPLPNISLWCGVGPQDSQVICSNQGHCLHAAVCYSGTTLNPASLDHEHCCRCGCPDFPGLIQLPRHGATEGA